MKKHTNFIFFFTIVFFLGIFATFLEKEETHKNDSSIVKEIKDKYRNGWAHKKIMRKKDYEEFREFSPDFFKRWVPRWKQG